MPVTWLARPTSHLSRAPSPPPRKLSSPHHTSLPCVECIPVSILTHHYPHSLSKPRLKRHLGPSPLGQAHSRFSISGPSHHSPRPEARKGQCLGPRWAGPTRCQSLPRGHLMVWMFTVPPGRGPRPPCLARQGTDREKVGCGEVDADETQLPGAGPAGVLGQLCREVHGVGDPSLGVLLHGGAVQ